MKFYLAPLEGITGYTYREVLHKYYGEGISKYFTPFLTPHTKCSFNEKERKDILPEHNADRKTVVQILTNSSEDFLRIAGDLKEYGYDELNINLGCPSGTVASKGRGAGFLKNPQELDRFLSEIFESALCSISLKTRIGIDNTEEFYELLEIYNKYPLKELIIHPRLLKEYYKGIPHQDIFGYALKNSANPLVYNGDIFSVEDYKALLEFIGQYEEKEQSKLHAVMIGRGVLKNPSLINNIYKFDQTNILADTDMEKVRDFHTELLQAYKETLSGDINVLYKMKEIWAYMSELFPNGEKAAKKIRKSKNLSEYNAAVNEMFAGIRNSIT